MHYSSICQLRPPVLRGPYLTCHYDAILNPYEPTNPLSGESVGEAAHVVLQRTAVAKELNVSTIDLDTASSLALEVLVAAKGGEAPVLGDNNLLATWELVLRSSQSLKSEVTVCLKKKKSN